MWWGLRYYYNCYYGVLIVDSGGGLYCFDPEDETKYYLMGVLHGGNAECTEDSYMYFSNNRHSSYRTLMNFEN